MEVGDDAKRSPCATDGKEHIFVLSRGGCDDGAIGEDDFGGEDLIGRCTELPGYATQTADGIVTTDTDLRGVAVGDEAVVF